MEQQEIYLLITRHLNEQATAEEEALLATWREQSEENRQLYSELQGMWMAATGTADIAGTEQALWRAKGKIRSMGAYIRRMAVAAVILVLITAGGFWLFSGQSSIPYEMKASGPGEILVLHLPDGTKVHLAPQSTIRYAKGRDVMLDGQALFEVTHNAHQPFTVRAGKVIVNVLGTRFNVIKNNTGAAVSLIDGKVQVKIADKAYTLQPGQEIRYDSATDNIHQLQYDMEDVTGWANRILVFRNETLAVAAKKIEQLYGVEIIIDDPVVAEYRLFARFENKSLEYILNVIKESDNLNYTIRDKKIYITQVK